MSIIVNTNSIATVTSKHLQNNQKSLQRSLARLSSGSKIVVPADDAGGLAVSNKLNAAINRNVRAQQNVMNALSFLQVQDGALKTVSNILDRMSELKTMSLDVTKNSADIANYDAEFNQLQDQLANIRSEKFNTIDLFATADSALTVYTTELGDKSGEPSVSIIRKNIFETGTNSTGLVSSNGYELSNSALAAGAGGDLASYSVDEFIQYIQNAATARADNGAQMQRLETSLALLKTNHTNVEAANSRLSDVDFATESTHFARNNIMVQSAASMLAQANNLPSVALQLLS